MRQSAASSSALASRSLVARRYAQIQKGNLRRLTQVLRQRRAQHLAMGDAEMAHACERRIDALVTEQGAVV